MTRSFPVLLSLAFFALFILGMVSGATTWVSVANLVTALGLVVTAIFSPHGTGQHRAGVGMLCFGGLAMSAWLGGVTVDATDWLTWWTFACATVTQLAGLAAISLAGPFRAGWLVPLRWQRQLHGTRWRRAPHEWTWEPERRPSL